ncbi:ATP-binding protein [Chitinimonas lacunae]|uniref:histidine kinase n=1 Tax=Chitinimonas lacunae TaxID=1963018 RepID=A0ABV8ML70_9NEIS
MTLDWVRHSIRRQILLVVLVTTLSALIVAGVALLFNDLRDYRAALAAELTTQADIVGLASSAALDFNDPKAAQETLLLLKAKPSIEAAALYTARGELFATYRRGTTRAELPALPELDGVHTSGGHMVLFKRVIDQRGILGTIHLRASYDPSQRLIDYLALLSAVTVLSLLVAFFLSSWLQRALTRPLLSITEVAQRVMTERDFSLRANKTSHDEVGYLVDAFNSMLAELGRRSEEVEASNRSLAHEAAERASVQKALQISERRNRTLVSAMAAVLWVADTKGAFIEPAPAWERYTGQHDSASHGLGWRDVFHPDDQPRLGLAWAGGIGNSAPFELELRLWHAASESYRYVSLKALPLLDEQSGEVIEWIGSITDIDDRRRAEESVRTLATELERRVAERTTQLEEANKELESFSYSVSHDLRAPVRAVVGFARLLAQDHGASLPPNAMRQLDIIQSEALRMGTLIDDLLAFSRLGRKALQPVRLDMRELVDLSCQALLAQHNGPTPEIRLGTLPVAHGDRALITQVWTNLLSNAFKFSARREQPLIEIGAISDEHEHVYFVRDNGAGFDARYKMKLFGVFQRLHDSTEFGGTGVGLALVHRIITRHGGRVWAEGALDQGATFYFTLPRETQNGTT